MARSALSGTRYGIRDSEISSIAKLGKTVSFGWEKLVFEFNILYSDLVSFLFYVSMKWFNPDYLKTQDLDRLKVSR